MQTTTNRVFPGQSEFVLVERLSASTGIQQLPQRLRLGADVHRGLSTVTALPPVLKQASYLPVDQHGIADKEVVQGNLRVTSKAPVKLYVAWPQLQEPPVWLNDNFSLVRGAEVKVRWSEFSFKQRFWLNITDQWRPYTEQSLLIYRLTSNNGVLLPGQQLELPALSTHPEAATTTGHPYYSHVVCLKPAINSLFAGGSCDIAAGTLGMNGRPVSSYSPQDLYCTLNHGCCDLSSLSQKEADALIQKSMLAADDELLFMLVEAGIGQQASHPYLQLLLRYAQLQDLLQLVLLVLHESPAEMTPEVLDWFVSCMVSQKRVHELEAALVQYCLHRRNPLSSVAAVEYAIAKAATLSLVVEEETLKLSKKFKAAKMALLQQLLDQFGPAGTFGLSPDKPANKRSFRRSVTAGNGGTASQQVTSGNSSHARLSVLQLRPIQQALHHCMQQTSAQALGTGGSTGPSSIHDSSPYGIAVSMEDADLLRMPAIMEYTNHVWQGLELQRMAQALHKAASAADQGVSSASSSSRFAAKHEDIKGQGQHKHADGAATGFQLPQPPPLAGAIAEGADEGAVSQDPFRRVVSFVSSGSSPSGLLAGSEADAHTTVWMSPDVGMQILQNLGLAGGLGSSLSLTAARLLHGILLAPRAFHSAPRGRWLKRCLFEFWFVLVFQIYCISKEAWGTLSIYLYSLPILVLGNLMNTSIEVHWLFNDNFGAYAKDLWAKLDVLVNVSMLLALMFQHFVFAMPRLNKYLHNTPEGQLGVLVEHVVPATLAVLVWARLLGLLLPASERLGALLHTVRQAATEAVFMVPLVLVMMIGFSTALRVLYGGLMPSYEGFIPAMRTMFVILSGGSSGLLDFNNAEITKTGFLRVWGQVLCIVYVVVVNILIMTLLIAIITKTYKPDYVKVKAVIQEAAAVHHYDWHVRHGLGCSPVNVMQVLLSWLPQGYRTRVSPSKSLRWGIFPLDGYVPEGITGSPAMLIPTGPSEVGYTAFCLLVYPLIGLAAVLLLLLHLPFGVVFFAIKGHEKWVLSSGWFGGRTTTGKDAPTSTTAWHRGPNDVLLTAGCRDSIDIPIAAARRTQLSTDLGQGCDLWAVKASPAVRRMIDDHCWGKHVPSEAVPSGTFLRRVCTWSKLSAVAPADGIAARQQVIWGTAVFRIAAACSSMLAVVGGLVGSVKLVLQVVLNAFIGLAAHLLVVALVIVTVVWAGLTRTVFSIYCIFVPAAADSNCCFMVTRHANFWSKSSMCAAFAAAKMEQACSHPPKLASASARVSFARICGDNDEATAAAAEGCQSPSSQADGHVFIAAKRQDTACHPLVFADDGASAPEEDTTEANTVNSAASHAVQPGGAVAAAVNLGSNEDDVLRLTSVHMEGAAAAQAAASNPCAPADASAARTQATLGPVWQ